ncbi:hypothetical protein V2I01_30540 [Micromonospora sp. BRA006-A]|nr:hypothetical protein [Micromonospora sp. BRA006-A]
MNNTARDDPPTPHFDTAGPLGHRRQTGNQLVHRRAPHHRPGSNAARVVANDHDIVRHRKAGPFPHERRQPSGLT